ncbi:hypothetical protein ACVILL_004550 [Bradyrhizobium sp. USDA 3364]
MIVGRDIGAPPLSMSRRPAHSANGSTLAPAPGCWRGALARPEPGVVPRRRYQHDRAGTGFRCGRRPARPDLCEGSRGAGSAIARSPQARWHRGVPGSRLGRGADRRPAVAAAVAGMGLCDGDVPPGRAQQPDGLCVARRLRRGRASGAAHEPVCSRRRRCGFRRLRLHGASGLRSNQPHIVKLGVATEAELAPDSFAARLRTEVVGMQGVFAPPTFVGAWSRKPG